MKKLILIILIGLLSLESNWLFSLYKGIPAPYIHDEFSYLLAADTFAHGRLTNPTHPLWEHFETFYVLQQPTYMSKYPPAQGFFMAIGQVLGGHPIYGVWISESLMCMAICWMLLAWVPLNWAFMGGIISVIQFGVFTYWSQSYWGGAVPALGGALVFGAVPRIFKYQRLRDVFWLGLGMAIVLNSRPLEGVLMGIPVACLALPWKIKWDKINSFYFVKKIIIPIILILTLIFIGIGAYNKAITGKSTLSPSILCLNNQMERPLLIFEPLKPIPVFKHAVFRQFINKYSTKNFLLKRTWNGFWTIEANDTHRMFDFFFGYILAIPVIFFFLRIFRKRMNTIKFILIILILAITCAVMPSRAHAHYFAPVMVLAVLLVVMGLRSMLILFKQRNMLLIYGLITLQLIINIFTYIQPVEIGSHAILAQGQGLALPPFTREEFQNTLLQMGGKHLVIVDYPPNGFFVYEWVQNSADIDNQKIVWARSMDEKENAKLLNYYKDRKVWRIKVTKERFYHRILI